MTQSKETFMSTEKRRKQKRDDDEDSVLIDDNSSSGSKKKKKDDRFTPMEERKPKVVFHGDPNLIEEYRQIKEKQARRM